MLPSSDRKRSHLRAKNDSHATYTSLSILYVSGVRPCMAVHVDRSFNRKRVHLHCLIAKQCSFQHKASPQLIMSIPDSNIMMALEDDKSTVHKNKSVQTTVLRSYHGSNASPQLTRAAWKRHATSFTKFLTAGTSRNPHFVTFSFNEFQRQHSRLYTLLSNLN